jgi:hypothetical protein
VTTTAVGHDPQPEIPIRTEQAADSTSPSRRTVPIVAACVGALVAVGTAAAVWLGLGSHSTPEPATLSASTLAAPVHLPWDTAYVETKVLPSGDLVVTHWIHSRKDLFAATLKIPHIAGLPVDDIAVSHLTVAGDGAVITTKQSGPGSGGRAAALAPVLLPGTHDLYVRYQLSGVLQKDSTVADRGLARLTALTVRTYTHLKRTTATVTGAKVLALACSPATPQAIPVPCGSAQGGSWSVQLDRGDVQDRVMAQLDLS